MGKKETKKYSDIPVQQTNASEPLNIYGDINAMKVQLVNRIMRIDEPEELNSVLEFVKEHIAQKDKFEQEWEQGLTVEDFRIQCKRKLKEMYVRN